MREDRLLLQDVLDAIAVIARYVPPSREKFDADPPLQSHLLRHIQIIGEAVARLTPALKAQHPLIPWRQIAGMRNVIVHTYFRIDWNEVWNTASRDVPALRPLIETVMHSLPPDQEP